MLGINQMMNAQAALSYFTVAPKVSEYHAADEPDTPSLWGGSLTQTFGLLDLDVIEQDQFEALLNNQHPVTGEKLTVRTRAKRRVGYDFTFNAPKSVSLVSTLQGDTRVKEAFEKAIRETMAEMEQAVQTRVRTNGQNTARDTGNFIFGGFLEETTRPVNGISDPHLHMHIVVPNVTFDEVENRFKAGEFVKLKQNAPYYEAAFHSRLMQHVQALGYGIRESQTGWEMAHISDEVIEKFSNRTKIIMAKAAELGMTHAKDLGALGAKTREYKNGLGLKDLRPHWLARLSQEEKLQLRPPQIQPGAQTLTAKGQPVITRNDLKRTQDSL